MIEAFLAAWRSFPYGFGSGVLVAALCGVVGIHIVLRRMVFVAMALSQMATLGVALALFMERFLSGHEDPHAGHPWFHCLADPALLSFLFVLLGMALVWAVRNRGGMSSEAWLGGLTAVASGASILVIAGSPHGLDEVKNLLFADFLLVQEDGFRTLLVLSVMGISALLVFRRRFLLAGFDPDQARAVGVPPGRWLLALDLLTALTIAFTIRAGGSLVVFGLLILPPLGILASARRMKGIWLWSPAVGVAGTCLGITSSMAFDWPAGPAIVAAVALSSISVGLMRAKLFS